MNLLIKLFKDSNCDNCKLMQKELVESSVDADINICHVRNIDDSTITRLNITEFPTTIIFDGDVEIKRYIGFVSSNLIDKDISNYIERQIRNKYLYLYVMDYATTSIHEIVLTEKDKSLEDYSILRNYGFNEDECAYMYSNHRLNIILA